MIVLVVVLGLGLVAAGSRSLSLPGRGRCRCRVEVAIGSRSQACRGRSCQVMVEVGGVKKCADPDLGDRFSYALRVTELALDPTDSSRPRKSEARVFTMEPTARVEPVMVTHHHFDTKSTTYLPSFQTSFDDYPFTPRRLAPVNQDVTRPVDARAQVVLVRHAGNALLQTETRFDDATLLRGLGPVSHSASASPHASTTFIPSWTINNSALAALETPLPSHALREVAHCGPDIPVKLALSTTSESTAVSSSGFCVVAGTSYLCADPELPASAPYNLGSTEEEAEANDEAWDDCNDNSGMDEDSESSRAQSYNPARFQVRVREWVWEYYILDTGTSACLIPPGTIPSILLTKFPAFFISAVDYFHTVSLIELLSELMTRSWNAHLRMSRGCHNMSGGNWSGMRGDGGSVEYSVEYETREEVIHRKDSYRTLANFLSGIPDYFFFPSACPDSHVGGIDPDLGDRFSYALRVTELALDPTDSSRPCKSEARVFTPPGEENKRMMAVQRLGLARGLKVDLATTPSPKQWAHKALLKVGLALHGPTLGYRVVVVAALNITNLILSFSARRIKMKKRTHHAVLPDCRQYSIQPPSPRSSRANPDFSGL
ncbi:hypothetical protein BDZ89DRAFT_1188229 [Hymenopellis radicata]|nr:hypothetical protein BDZ89DRAFT_1188229 [Hymenopellis radicata]